MNEVNMNEIKIKTYKVYSCGVQDKTTPSRFDYNIKFNIRPMSIKERFIFKIKKFWNKFK